MTPSLRNIRSAVAWRFEITEADITGPSRQQVFAVPRMVGYLLAREMTDASLPAIGRAFGNRDHTTVMTGIASIRIKAGKSYDLRRDIAAVRVEAERLAVQERGGMFRSCRATSTFTHSTREAA